MKKSKIELFGFVPHLVWYGFDAKSKIFIQTQIFVQNRIEKTIYTPIGHRGH